MAIIIEEEKRKINWFAVVIGIFLIALLGAIIYYLFFAQSPLIDVVVPVQVQSLSQLSQIKFDTNQVLSHSIYDSLQSIIPPLSVGTTTIRVNPFMP